MEIVLKELLYVADHIVKRCLCLYRAKTLDDSVRKALIVCEQSISNVLTEIHLNISD
jgi:hypothetical protein